MSATVSGIRLPIFAVDNATAVINSVGRSLSKLSVPARQASHSVSGISANMGLGSVTFGMRNLGQSTLGFARALERAVPAMGVLTGIGSLGGIVLMERRFANVGQQLGNLGRSLGIPVERLTALQGAARLGGASAADLTTSLTSLDEKLRGATFRQDAVAIQTFNALGVSFGSLGHYARTADDALGDVADGIKRVYETQGRGAAYRAAQNLGMQGIFSVLLQGRAGIAEWEAKARSLGATMSEAMIERSEKMHQSFAGLSLAIEGTSNKIGYALEPAISGAVDWMSAWIGRNQDWIANGIGSAVNSLAAKLESIPWGQYLKDAETFFNAVIKPEDPTKPPPPADPNHRETFTEYVHRVITQARYDWNKPPLYGPPAPRQPWHLSNFPLPHPHLEPSTVAPEWPGIASHLRPGSYDNGPLPWAGGGIPGGSRALPGPLNPEVEREVRRDARLAGLDENRMVALFRAEGGGFRNVSNRGAFGPAQLMPETARSLGLPDSVNDPRYDWRQNVMGGIRYFASIKRDTYGQGYDAAEAGYNAGPANPGVIWLAHTGSQGALPTETRNYVQEIDRMSGAPGEVPSADSAGTGSVTVSINAQGFPAGTKIDAVSSGIATVLPAAVSMSLPMMGQ